jgi:4-amino-4-deoxy-L-arabinose transferase-like glycosyltransferase
VKWTEVGALAAVALLVRLPHLADATLWYDEYFHLLAARQWLEDGTFAIAGGEYSRAAFFTRLVAGSVSLFGDTMVAARIPSVLAGVLWAALVFGWTRRVAGPLAGWIAGLLFALDPGAIFLSQMVRFYSLHGLLVLAGLLSIYRVTETPAPSRRTAVPLVLVGIASLGFATMLQPLTLIAIAAAGIWVGGILLGRLPSWLARGNRVRKGLLLTGAVVAGLVVLGWAVSSGALTPYLRAYRGTYYWMNGELTSSHWYVWWLRGRYPVLWMLFPIAAGLALLRARRAAGFALTMFVVSFVTLSLASVRSERFLYFALPFFFVVWAIALATLLPALFRLGTGAAAALAGSRLGERARSSAGALFVIGSIGFFLFENNAFRLSLGMITAGPEQRPYREANWDPVVPRLKTLADSADVVLSSFVLVPLYYLGRGDAHLSWTETAETRFANGLPVEFSINRSTGLPTLSTPESLARVMACYNSGLVLTERFHLNRPHLLSRDLTAFLTSQLEEVPFPSESWVVAFRWHHPVALNRTGCPPPGFRPAGSPLPNSSSP